jgi:hypothetical protein
MKHLLIVSIVIFLVTLGNAQNHQLDSQTDIQLQAGPKMKQAQIDQVYFKEMEKNTETKGSGIPSINSTKLSEKKYEANSEFHVKYQSAENPQAKQILNHQQGKINAPAKKQYFSRTKSNSKLRRVQGYAPREKMVKMENLPQYSQDVLIEALGKSQTIKADNSKTIESKK